jgi:hypothetical protein
MQIDEALYLLLQLFHLCKRKFGMDHVFGADLASGVAAPQGAEYVLLKE